RILSNPQEVDPGRVPDLRRKHSNWDEIDSPPLDWELVHPRFPWRLRGRPCAARRRSHLASTARIEKQQQIPEGPWLPKSAAVALLDRRNLLPRAAAGLP